jgi:hypothetical protein
VPYRIEYGPPSDRRVKLRLTTDEVIPAYDRLIAAGEPGIEIFSPDGSNVEPHILRLATNGVRFD